MKMARHWPRQLMLLACNISEYCTTIVANHYKGDIHTWLKATYPNLACLHANSHLINLGPTFDISSRDCALSPNYVKFEQLWTWFLI